MLLKKNLILAIVSLVLFSALLAGCKSKASQPQPEQSVPGLANPASVYCQGLGFKEETRQNAAGEYGVCIFPDGTECDTWDFLAGRCGQEHSYCVKQGFKLQVTQASIGTCVFDDGSTCDEFQYYQGNCKPGDNKP